jgi:hypothetical protein
MAQWRRHLTGRAGVVVCEGFFWTIREFVEQPSQLVCGGCPDRVWFRTLDCLVGISKGKDVLIIHRVQGRPFDQGSDALPIGEVRPG